MKLDWFDYGRLNHKAWSGSLVKFNEASHTACGKKLIVLGEKGPQDDCKACLRVEEADKRYAEKQSAERR